MLLPGQAHAERTEHGGISSVEEKGDTGDGEVSSTVGVEISSGGSDTETSGSGQLTPLGGWSPPACWYAPKWTAQEAAQSRLDGMVDLSPQHDAGNAESMKDKYINGEHGAFNVEKNDEGYWWGAYKNPDRLGDSAAMECNDMPFWVDTGDEPPADIENAITPEILAQLAYEEIRIPEGTATLQPADDRQVVNLPTWVSLDDATFHPVSATASVDVLGISATTTARPAGIHIDPGTDDALTYPESGDCPLGDDGGIGQKRPAGAEGPPPCGVKYLRSSEATGPYPFQATVTWKVSWTGTHHPEPTDLPSGTFGTPQDVTVNEIQSIVR
ncbi:hypothetical protein [Streptomyces sp. MAR4 CNX-425]|uniref:hypothetical protein n=1 Tax=Streptomyces sp. MAR4 CNX-425 TaxID=3406343 RepID=UPI003B51037D